MGSAPTVEARLDPDGADPHKIFHILCCETSHNGGCYGIPADGWNTFIQTQCQDLHKETQHCENSALSNVNLIPGIRFRARNGGRSRQLLVAMASGNLLLDD